MYKHKSVTFNPDSHSDIELWEWLQKRKHGDFNKMTKAYWKSVMRGEASDGSEKIRYDRINRGLQKDS